MKIKKGVAAFLLLFFAFLISNKQVVVKADESVSLKFDENGITAFGNYFQTLEKDIPVDTIKNDGVYEDRYGAYRYNGNLYRVIDSAAVDYENEDNGYLSDTSTKANTLRGQSVAFKYEPIKWAVLSQKDGYVQLISTSILCREKYNNTSSSNLAYRDSSLFTFLNTNFVIEAFGDDEVGKLIGNDGLYVNIPSKTEIDNLYSDFSFKASDYAILNDLSNNRGYTKAPFWTSTSSGSNRMDVKWTQSEYTGCLYTDAKIGVVPVITLYAPDSNVPVDSKEKDNKDNNGGQTGRVSNVDSSVIKIIVGGVLIIGGMAFFIMFFKKWMKKLKENEKFKLPKWQYSLVGGGFIICLIGIILISSTSFGLAGFSSGQSVVGWYGGNMVDCVQWGERLSMNLTKDGKVYRYVGDAWSDEPGSATNWTCIRQDGVGTYTYSKGKLTIYAAPEWKLSSWETPVTVYTDCHGLGSFIKYEGYEGTAYSWHHYSNIDSNGIAAIKNIDTQKYDYWN